MESEKLVLKIERKASCRIWKAGNPLYLSSTEEAAASAIGGRGHRDGGKILPQGKSFLLQKASAFNDGGRHQIRGSWKLKRLWQLRWRR